MIIVRPRGGVFAGFTQGMIRYVLNSLAVIVAFVLAAQLKGPILDLLGFWEAFTPEGRELLIFVLLFFGFVVAAFFVIRAVYHRTRLPIATARRDRRRDLRPDLRRDGHQLPAPGARQLLHRGRRGPGWVASYYDALNGSVIVGFFRDTIIPTAGFLARPFVPTRSPTSCRDRAPAEPLALEARLVRPAGRELARDLLGAGSSTTRRRGASAAGSSRSRPTAAPRTSPPTPPAAGRRATR